MFLIAAITGLLICIAIVSFVYGTIQLARYAFRVSTGRGLATLLVPPYTLYFAFAELDEEDKAIPTASWVFGLFVTVLLGAIFWQPISLLATGQTDQLVAEGPGSIAERGEEESSSEEPSAEAEEPTEESEASGDQEAEESSDDDSASDDEESADSEGDSEGDSDSEDEADDSEDDSSESSE